MQLVVVLVVAAALVVAGGAAHCGSKRAERTETFLSPGILLRPGDVTNKLYNIDAPAGSFATVDFDAELVYENGESVPLTDVYLHHWVMYELTIPEGGAELAGQELREALVGSGAHVYHSGNHLLSEGPGKRQVKQIWAKGGETRHLNSSIPAPYGMVSGGPGLRTHWVLNVHAIDTRGARDSMRCTECLCELFTGGNRTSVPENYLGGLFCCSDGSRCALRDDVDGDNKDLERTVHLKYRWTYIPLDESVVPLTDLGLDVTASGSNRGTVEYDVEGHCEMEDFHKPECVDVRETVIESQYGGDLVYVVAHLHSYSLDATLWGEDGRLLCSSPPIYGHGEAAGDEKGYVVGIRHCNPSLGPNGTAGKIRKGEKLRLQVKYTRVNGPHTGVMGFLFAKIAEEPEIMESVATLRGVGNRKILT